MEALKPTIRNSTQLDQLPGEILHNIASFLQPSAAASVSCVSKSILNVLGTQHWNSVAKLDGPHCHRTQRMEFLSLIAPSIAHETIPCRHCQTLHYDSKRRQKYPLDEFRSHTCGFCDIESKVWMFIHNAFSSNRFRMIMDLHHRGADASKQLTHLKYSWLSTIFAYTERSWTSAPKRHLIRPNFLRFTKSIPRIVEDHLILRTQDWFIFPSDEALKHNPMHDIVLSICPHTLCELGDDASFLKHLLNWQITYSKDKHLYQSGTQERRCSYCPIVFCLDLVDYKKGRPAMVVTRWLDLGEGKECTDPYWWSHTDENLDDPNGYTLWDGHGFPEWDLRSAFEGRGVMTDDASDEEYDAEYLAPPRWEIALAQGRRVRKKRSSRFVRRAQMPRRARS